MNGYVALYRGKRLELYANTLYEAKQKAIAQFKPRKSDEHMVIVMLAEKDGKDVVHQADI